MIIYFWVDFNLILYKEKFEEDNSKQVKSSSETYKKYNKNMKTIIIIIVYTFFHIK